MEIIIDQGHISIRIQLIIMLLTATLYILIHRMILLLIMLNRNPHSICSHLFLILIPYHNLIPNNNLIDNYILNILIPHIIHHQIESMVLTMISTMLLISLLELFMIIQINNLIINLKKQQKWKNSNNL